MKSTFRTRVVLAALTTTLAVAAFVSSGIRANRHRRRSLGTFE